ncbi:MAG: hypothetical protein J7L39_00615 [Candidatus Aenigmarchaeota archaeon]|nr:hypothetical protein [Candidatus Aenigmarchaeota archaeon]
MATRNYEHHLFLDECVLLGLIFGGIESTIKNLHTKYVYHGKVKVSKNCLEPIVNYLNRFYYRDTPCERIYVDFVNWVRRYRESHGNALNFYSSSQILKNVKEKVERAGKINYECKKLIDSIINEIDGILAQRSSTLTLPHKSGNIFRLKLGIINLRRRKTQKGNYVYLRIYGPGKLIQKISQRLRSKEDSEIMYEEKNRVGVKIKEDEKFEKAILIYVDPSDKKWLEMTYYGNLDALLTLDTRIVKRNPKVYRFLAIVNPLELKEIIEMANKYGWKKVKWKLEKEFKEEIIKSLGV